MNNIQGVDELMALIPLCYTGEKAVKQRRRRLRKKRKGEGSSGIQKRKLSLEQATMLEQHFACEHKLDSERKDRLAMELGLDPRQVAVWFQNRRARWKSKKLEEELSMLKNEYATTIIQKCQLETENLKLKEQLNKAEREIVKIVWERQQQTSSLSFEMGQPNSLFGELDNMFYLTPQFTNWSDY